MSHILITFLGKSEKDGECYSKECYEFENDTQTYEKNFFGLALLEHLKNTEKQADKLVVLGTPSSMWDAFFELEGEFDPTYEDDWIELGDAIKENSERPEEEEEREKEKISEYLTTLEKVISEQQEGIDCKLRVIPYGESQDKQIAILKEMAECVEKNDTVSLDITHGLRHLPMLVVLSAMYLEVVKNVKINGIYYGAQELKNRHKKVAPALDLSGLLGIAKWYGALKSFDKDGDYGVFAQLLEQDGFTTKQTKNLKNAAFFERIIDIENATNKLNTVQNNIERKVLNGISSLFSQQLQERISWHKVDPSLDKKIQVYHQQRKLAFSYLEKGDYVRAANFALEAIKSRKLNKEDNPYDYKKRETVKNDLLQQADKDYLLLNEIRNQLAHGSYYKDNKRNKQARELLQNEDKLRSKLKELMESLLK